MALICHSDGREFNRNSLFPLQLHAIEQLRLHVTLLDRTGQLHHPIGQGRFSVIDMRDNTEIADLRLVHVRFFPKKSRRTNVITGLASSSANKRQNMTYDVRLTATIVTNFGKVARKLWSVAANWSMRTLR